MLQSSYTSKTSGRSYPYITVGRYGLGDEGDGSCLAISQGPSKSYAITS